jgi:hypothetical protein
MLAWLALMLYKTRYAMLDDSLIHLRYAAFLHNVHHITFDGVHASYGTSSLLYVNLLALLRGIATSVFLPKIVSSVCYVTSLLILAVGSRRFATRRVARAIWIGLLLTMLSPMAVRWLTDGMETSLVAVFVITLALLVQRSMHREPGGVAVFAAWTIGGALLVLLRIELASLCGLAACTLACGRMATHNFRNSRSLTARWISTSFQSAAILLGAILALLGTRLVFGSFLPDTALAKSSVAAWWPLQAIIHCLIGAAVFGISATILTFVSGALLLRALIKHRKSSYEKLAWLFANLPFPLLIALACLRGQEIQGVRTVVWPLLFTTVWNALQLERLRRELPPSEIPPPSRIPLSWAYAAFLLCLLPIGWHYAMHAMMGRAQTFLEMRKGGLARFQHSTIVAGDVGFISYFTGGYTCDIDGLVNGREAAKMSPEERIAACAARHPKLLFLTTPQMKDVSAVMPIQGWTNCGHYDFTNVIGSDRHYLLVPRPSLCPVPTQSPGPDLFH